MKVSATARLVGMFVRATCAQRVLLVGVGDHAMLSAIMDALPDDGLLLAIDGDHTSVAAARQMIAARGGARQASVIAADPARYLHKLGGPFDVIVRNGRPSAFEPLHGRLVHLLAASGTLITHNINEAAEYNKVLNADQHLTTMTMNVGGGVAVSVKHRPQNTTQTT